MKPEEKTTNKTKETQDDIREDIRELANAVKAQSELMEKTLNGQKEPEKKTEPEKKEPKPAVRRIDLTENTKRDVKNISDIINMPTRMLSDAEQELREFCDDAYITASLLKTDPRNLKMWQQFQSSDSALRKAMDTATSGEGSEWVPDVLSTQLIEKYRLQARVPGLFTEIQMPANPYKLPTDLGDMTFYLISESLSAEPSKTPTTKLTTGDLTLTAKKFRGRSIWSEELDEESIIPILPRVKENIARSAALAVEDAIINGDTTATHQDSDVTDSKDHRKAWKGLRKHALEQSYDADMSTFDKDTTLARITAMGKYGITKSELIWIASVVSYNKALALTEMRTVDKYGPKATILTGEVGKLYGVPFVVSEKVRENLNNSGVYDGSTTDKSGILLVNKNQWVLGNRGNWKLTVDFDNDVDQYVLNVRFKKAFIPIRAIASNHIVEYGYKIS